MGTPAPRKQPSIVFSSPKAFIVLNIQTISEKAIMMFRPAVCTSLSIDKDLMSVLKVTVRVKIVFDSFAACSTSEDRWNFHTQRVGGAFSPEAPELATA